MAYKSGTISATPATFVSTPKHSKTKPIGVKIHNADTVDRVITGTDAFTTDRSEGAGPGAQTRQWLRVSVANGKTLDISRQEIEEAALLGDVKFACDAVTTNNPVVSLIYVLE